MTLNNDTFAYAEKHESDVLDREERAAVVSALLQYFHLWTPAAFIDDENLGEVGKLVGRSRHLDMDVAIQEMLRTEPSSAMHIVGGAFLGGYWLRKPVSEAFNLELYAGALDTFPTIRWRARRDRAGTLQCPRGNRLAADRGPTRRGAESLVDGAGPVPRPQPLPRALGQT